MKIYIGRLRKEPGAREDFNYLLEERPEFDGVTFSGSIAVQGQITNTGGDFLDLVMRITTEARLLCGRCLEPVIVPLEFEVTEQYCPEEEREKYFAETEDNCLPAVTFFKDDWLDLQPILRENLMLAIPMRVLCTPDCPGLCPSCGQNLREGSCPCVKQQQDPRLAVLAQLREKLEP